MHGHKQVTKLFWGLASYLQGHPPHRLLLTIKVSDVCWQLCKEPDAEQAASECSLSFPSLQLLLLLIWKMGIRQGNKLDLLQLQHLAKKQILFIHHPVYLALIHLDRDLTMNTQAREGPSRPDTRVPCSQVHRTGGSTRCLHFLSACLCLSVNSLSGSTQSTRFLLLVPNVPFLYIWWSQHTLVVKSFKDMGV